MGRLFQDFAIMPDGDNSPNAGVLGQRDKDEADTVVEASPQLIFFIEHFNGALMPLTRPAPATPDEHP